MQLGAKIRNAPVMLVFLKQLKPLDVNATILFMGLDLSIKDEGLDRMDLKFPRNQELLINSIADASNNPVVLVILSGRGIDITTLKNNPKLYAIVWAGYPGAEGGCAIVDILFGNHNPGTV